jgi:signal peptidase
MSAVVGLHRSSVPKGVAGQKHRVRALLGLALGIAVRGLAGFAAVIAAAAILPALVWHASFTVLSGSMTPTLRVGDIVVDRPIAPLDVRIGDVITFKDPDNPARLLTHRVVQMRATGEMVGFVTRGDANTGVERWSIPKGGSVGRVALRIPLAGYISDRAGSRFGRLGLLVFPALLLALFELKRIWRRDEPAERAADPEPLVPELDEPTVRTRDLRELTELVQRGLERFPEYREEWRFHLSWAARSAVDGVAPEPFARLVADVFGAAGDLSQRPR